MSTFSKLSNGRIIFVNNKTHSFIPAMNILPHPSDSSLILISPYASGQQATDEGFAFVWNDVTVPSGAADRDALILELSVDYFTEHSIDTDTSLSKTYTIEGKKNTISASVLDDLSEIAATTSLPRPGGIALEIVGGAQDNGSGTGIQAIDIVYLDSSFIQQKVTIVPTGATPITIPGITDFEDIQWMSAAIVGSGEVAAGDILLRGVGAGTTYEKITAGGNQSLSGRYKVPVGKVGYIEGCQVSGFAQRIDFRLRATVDRLTRNLIPGVFFFQDIATLTDEALSWRPFKKQKKCPALTVIKMSGLSATASGSGSGSFDIRIENL